MRITSLASAAAIVSLLAFSPLSYGADIVVDVTSDGTGTAGECELRDAIEAANADTAVDGCAAGAGDDRITFNVAGPTITLTSALPQISESVEIIGPGKNALTLSGDDSFRLFYAEYFTGHLTLKGLRLLHGVADMGGCLLINSVITILLEDLIVDSCVSDTFTGGGAQITAVSPGTTVTLRRVEFNKNISLQSGGGLGLSTRDAHIEDSLFIGNIANGAGSDGGAISVGAATILTITRSTFLKNKADDTGTAIDTFTSLADISIEHSTISQNELLGTDPSDIGGAIHNTGTLTLFNTVVGDNFEENANHDVTDINNDASATLTTLGYNLIGNNEGAAAVFPAGLQANGDRNGTAVSPLATGLGVVQDNGGPTRTVLPLAGSPLIDKGSCPGEVRDQRGYGNNNTGMRPVNAPGVGEADDGCDTGATEYLASAPPEEIHEDGFEDE